MLLGAVLVRAGEPRDTGDMMTAIGLLSLVDEGHRTALLLAALLSTIRRRMLALLERKGVIESAAEPSSRAESPETERSRTASGSATGRRWRRSRPVRTGRAEV